MYNIGNAIIVHIIVGAIILIIGWEALSWLFTYLSEHIQINWVYG